MNVRLDVFIVFTLLPLSLFAGYHGAGQQAAPFIVNQPAFPQPGAQVQQGFITQPTQQTYGQAYPAAQIPPAQALPASAQIRQTDATVIPDEKDKGLMETGTQEVKQWFSQAQKYVEQVGRLLRTIEKERKRLNDEQHKLDAQLDEFLLKASTQIGSSRDAYNSLARRAISRLIEKRDIKKGVTEFHKVEQPEKIDPEQFSTNMRKYVHSIEKLESKLEKIDDEEDAMLEDLHDLDGLVAQASDEAYTARSKMRSILKAPDRAAAKSLFDSVADSLARVKKMSDEVQREVSARFSNLTEAIQKDLGEVDKALNYLKKGSQELRDKSKKILDKSVRDVEKAVKKQMKRTKKKLRRAFSQERRRKVREAGEEPGIINAWIKNAVSFWKGYFTPDDTQEPEEPGFFSKLMGGLKTVFVGTVNLVQEGFNQVYSAIFEGDDEEEEEEIVEQMAQSQDELAQKMKELEQGIPEEMAQELEDEIETGWQKEQAKREAERAQADESQLDKDEEPEADWEASAGDESDQDASFDLGDADDESTVQDDADEAFDVSDLEQDVQFDVGEADDQTAEQDDTDEAFDLSDLEEGEEVNDTAFDLTDTDKQADQEADEVDWETAADDEFSLD